MRLPFIPWSICRSAFEPGASELPDYCTSTCACSFCTWRASCVDSKPKKKKERRQDWGMSASTGAHGGGHRACSVVAQRSTILPIHRKAVPKAQPWHDALEHVCGKRRRWSSAGQRADSQRLPVCLTKQHPGCSSNNPPARALLCFLSMFAQIKPATQLTPTKAEVDKDLCVRVSFACTCHALACAYQCACAQHLPVRSMLMPASALCLRVFLLWSDIWMVSVFKEGPIHQQGHQEVLPTTVVSFSGW